jgi:5'-nucleotidase
MTYEIVADFDGTLTRKGEGCGTSFDALRVACSEETRQKSEEIYKLYGPKEFDFYLKEEERKKLMEEWWEKEFELTVEGGLYKDELMKEEALSHMVFRHGARELFSFAKEHNIPLLVFTAGVADAIEYKLQREELLSPNLTIVGNRFIFGENGKATGYVKPVVFVGNKHLVAQSFESKVHHDVAFVLGDHPTDAEMCLDANHAKVLRFGFLNEKLSDKPAFQRYNYLYEEKGVSLMPAFEIIKKEVEGQ